MTKPLPPFSGDDAQCRKCSNIGAYTEWKPAERMGGTTLREERLRRRCGRCDFEWDETLSPPQGDGPSIAEATAADRNWNGEKGGE